MLQHFLESAKVYQVLNIVPLSLQGSYRMVWTLTNNGLFIVSSTYNLVRKVSNCSLLSSNIWHKSLPVKISFFMLRLLCFKLPIMDQLRRFGV